MKLAQQRWQEMIVVSKVTVTCSSMLQVQVVAGDAFSDGAHLNSTA